MTSALEFHGVLLCKSCCGFRTLELWSGLTAATLGASLGRIVGRSTRLPAAWQCRAGRPLYYGVAVTAAPRHCQCTTGSRQHAYVLKIKAATRLYAETVSSVPRPIDISVATQFQASEAAGAH